MKKNYLISLFIVFCLVFTLGNGLASAEEEITIGLSMPSLDTSFFLAEYNRINEIAEAEGINVETVVAEGSISTQMDQIEDLLASGIDAIIIRPVDTEAIVSSIDACAEEGVPVSILGRVPADKTNVDFIVTVDNNYAAKYVADWLYEQKQERGIDELRIIELQGDLRDQVAVELSEGFNARVEELDGMTVVNSIPTEYDLTLAQQRFNDAAQTEDFNAVWMTTDMFMRVVTQTLRNFGMLHHIDDDNHILIGAVDGYPDYINYVREGYTGINMAIDAVQLGEEGIKAAIALARGEDLEESFYTLPHTPITLENIDDDELADHWSIKYENK